MNNNALLTIGLISDTHIPYRLKILPPVIFDIFANVDIILHAGDVDKIEYLSPLNAIAPLYAVRGNIHLTDFSLGGRELPEAVHLTLAKRQIIVTHGHRKGLIGWLLKVPDFLLWKFFKHKADYLNLKIAIRLKKQYPQADIIIFGHTHRPFYQTVDNTLFINPGGVVPTKNQWASVGLLRLWEDKVDLEIIKL